MNKNILLSAIAALFLFVSFNVKGQALTDQKEFVKYLDAMEKQYEEISVYFGTQTWNLYSMEGKADLPGAKAKYASLFNDEKLRTNVTAWYGKLKTSDDLILKRRVQIWKTMLDAARVDYDTEIANVSAVLLDEVRNRDEKNVEQTKELEKKVLNLIKLRNKKAQQFGFNNYPEFVLEYTGIGYKWFMDLVNKVEERTAPAYKELFEKIKGEKGKVSVSDIRQYQKYLPESNFSKDSLYLVMKESLAAIGIDYSKLPIRFVVKNADFGGNCIAVSIPEDLRVIMVPDMPISVYLHELGHGMQWMKAEINNPILEGYEWCMGNGGPAFAEGMAETLANFCRQPLWFKKYTKLTDEQITNMLIPDKFSTAIRLRRTLIRFLIEIEIYKNPDADPSQLVADLNKKYLWIENAPSQLSLANTIFMDYPIYMHNYFLAEMIGWQVHDALKQKFGEGYVFNNQVGRFLIDNLYKNGMIKEWQGILKGATGKNLDIDGFLKSLGM